MQINHKVAIVIPHYRAEEKLRKCIAAINNQSHQNIEIFVTDNSKDNILYTAAINEGLRKYAFSGDIDFILILSHDAYLQIDTLKYLLDAMNQYSDCGIASPIQLSELTQKVTWGGSMDAFPNGVHVTESLEWYQHDFDTYWANGAAMLLRTSMIREIGLLDENMRFICSDSDYSFTARARGWKIKVPVNAKIYHAPNSSLQTNNRSLEIIKTKDWLYFASKWVSGGLYRALAYEAEKLSRMKVNLAIEAFEQQLHLLSVGESSNKT
ncbi:glycosyltransferase family 2 protein [Polynucleobacter paneuropaeus]|nr:glycosyltransferase family 2 protein [Polynucleobacter paneuropaeus]